MQLCECGANLVDDHTCPLLLPRWISVKERLPEDGQRVLIFAKPRVFAYEAATIFLTDFHLQIFSDDDYQYSPAQITHWMPLPEPPKEEK